MNNDFIPPGSKEIEATVLGSCLVDQEAIGSIMEILKPDDFSQSHHRILYSHLLEMYAQGIPPDIVTVGQHLREKGLFDRMGGQSFINSLVAGVSSTANAAYYAEIIREYSIRRKVIDAGGKISALARDFSKPVNEILEDAQKLLFDAGQNKNSSEFRHIREIIGPVFVNIENKQKSSGQLITGYPTGFDALDAYTGGLQPGSLTIVAARPSMGKTAFALNLAQFGGGEANPPVLVFSLEMPASQLVQRMLAAQSGINLSSLNTGTFDVAQFTRLREACDALAQRSIFINDATQLSGMEFLARCRQFKTRNPELALVIVDYLQLMSNGERRMESRNQEVSDISRMLKATAREINCPVVALSQLSREAEKRTDKKPQLSDLRDSGAIEQDADVVLMLFREDYYTENENNDLTDSKADIRVAKNRNGGTGVFHLTFQREITRFYDYGGE